MVNIDTQSYFLQQERLSIEEVKIQYENFLKSDTHITILDSINVMILILNKQRQIVFANKAYLKRLGLEEISYILGKTPGESVNCKNIYETDSICGTTEACQTCDVSNMIIKCMNLNTEVEGEATIVSNLHNLNNTLNLFGKVVPMEIEDNQLYLVSFVDATDTVMKRTMERIFFHDITNIVGAIRGLLSLLKDDVPNSFKEEINLVENMFLNLMDEIDSQKQVLSAENGELVLNITEFASMAVLKSVKNLYKGYGMLENKTIEIDSKSINIIVENDISLLKRVVGNMVKNALEATKINCKVEIGCFETDDNYLQYWVKNKEFIPLDIQCKIFDRSFSTKGLNRGLGTYSIKLLGEKYLKGTVGFSSDLEEGTSFYIKIPMLSV